MAGLPTVPEIALGTRATWVQREEPKEVEEADKLQFCEVDRTQFQRIEQNTDGEDVLVWVRGQRRMGSWAKSKNENSGDIAVDDAEAEGT
ncbi:hypothetical protein FQN54_009832 [Arachnomyces sp. PD_36]|nr:hypothetical protein FQN54_009832 [Arachnomyces sp. PD_36]